MWKKVGPFRYASRKAFKLSPHFLLPSYRNLLEVLFASLDNGVWTLFPYFDFLLLSYSIVKWLTDLRDIVCFRACVYVWLFNKGFGAYRHTVSGVQVQFACWQTVMIQDGTCLTDVFTATALSHLQLGDSPCWQEISEPEAKFETRPVVVSSEVCESVWGRGSVLVVRLKPAGC